MNHAHPRSMAYQLAKLSPEGRTAIASVLRTIPHGSIVNGLSFALAEIIDSSEPLVIANVIERHSDEAELGSALDRELSAAESRRKAGSK